MDEHAAESEPRVRRRRRRRLLVLLLPVIVVLIACPASNFFYQRSAHLSGIRCAEEWARLAPIPVPPGEVDVETQGSMFTREFTVSFTADAATIDRWLRASPGPSEMTPLTTGRFRTFRVQPGGGAMFAEVKIDEETGRVTIHTYWS